MSPVSHRGRRRLDPAEPVERLRGLLAEDTHGARADAQTEELTIDAAGTVASAEVGNDGPTDVDGSGAASDVGDPPDQWRTPLRWRLPWPALLMAVLAVVAVVVTVLVRASGSDQAAVTSGAETSPSAEAFVTQAAGTAGPDAAAPVGAVAAADGADLVVHVVGEVQDPGVVEVAQGSRVSDAVDAAGGLTDAAVVDGVNLAAPVSDGAQVVIPDAAGADAARTHSTVPTPGPPASGVSDAPRTAQGAPAENPPLTGGGGGAPVNLNTASVAELEELPKVGPVLAQRIVEHRDHVGGFRSVAELDDVSGIGPAMMTALEPLVTV